MRHPPLRSDAAAILAICIFALSASAAEPATVVREFFARYAASDLRGASSLWVRGTAADDFVHRHARRMEKRCLELESLTIDASSDPQTLDVTATVILRSAAGGMPWRETSRSRFALTRDGETWRIAAWEPLEAALVDRLVRAGNAEDQRRVLDSSSDVETTTFVRVASQRSIDLVNQGRVDDADLLSSAALDVAERLGDPVSLAASMTARSVVLRRRHDGLPASLSMAEEAVRLAESGGDPDVLASALVRSARAAESLRGVPDQKMLERALALSDQLEDVALAAHAAVHLGRAHELNGRLRDAFRLFELAYNLAEESGDPAARTSAAIALNGAYGWLGDSAMGARYGRRAVELARHEGFESSVLGIIGEARYIAARDPAKAMRILDNGLQTTRDPHSLVMLLLARARCAADTALRLDEAELDLDRVATLVHVDPAMRQEIELIRALIARTGGDDDAALSHFEAAAGPNIGFDRTSRHGRAEILLRKGRLDEARAILEELIADEETGAIVDPQRGLFHALAYPSHRLLVELLVAEGESSAALRLSEELKANELSMGLARGKSAATMAPDDEAHLAALEERLRELNRHLVGARLASQPAGSLRQQLSEARADLLDFRQRLYFSRPAAAIPLPSDFCPGELPPQLDDVTVVSYVTENGGTLVFVLEPKRNGRRELRVRHIAIDASDLNARVERFAALIEQRNLRAPDAAAEMYNLLLAPIEPAIHAAKLLCIIPDGSLWRIPFQVLGPRGGPLLVERVPLFYAPSLTMLNMTASRRMEPRPSKPRLLAFGNPFVAAKTASLYRAFDPDAPLGALPETESEVRAIARIYGSDASRVYIGRTARETTLKREASHFDILHIATHGVVYDNAPMFSSLLLTDDPTEDGLLEAREIAGLVLDADLTVLSACETGRAGNGDGSGVIGLAWAFFAAGCRTTVVSQWKAHSTASATLMVELHRQLARGRSKPEALRRAQLALRADPRYRHPFYWAPFVVIGMP